MFKRTGIGLGITFVCGTLAAMLLALILIGFAALVMINLGLVSFHRNPFLPLVAYLSASTIISVILTGIVSKTILRPIRRISAAAREVAKGNYSLALNEVHIIKEVREISRDFNLMAKELSGVETLRTDFVADVSHEFKTPLAAIEGYATLLTDEDLSAEERQGYTRMIIDASRQMSALVGNVLSLSGLEKERDISQKEFYRLDEQIRQAILLLEQAWTEKEIELNLALINAEYFGNERLISQVWLNIIGNAIKFSPMGGEITVIIERFPGGLSVSVTDTGAGIPSFALPYIFNKFYQADKVRKESGNGLGLALAKRIVDLCGGHIEVYSREGLGATFTVKLPDPPDMP